MPTLQDLGKLVKQKYPQYSDVPDAELGKKIKEKYPNAYSQFTDDGSSSVKSEELPTENARKGVINSFAEATDKVLGKPAKFVGETLLGNTARFGTTLGKAASGSLGLTGETDKQAVASADADFELAKMLRTASPEQKARIQSMLSDRTTVGVGTNNADLEKSSTTTAKEVIGQGIGTALEVGSAGILGAAPSAVTKTGSIVAGKTFAKKAASRAAQVGSLFAVSAVSGDLQKDADTLKIIKDAAGSFALGALGSGIFSGAKYGIAAVTTPQATSNLFKAGLGFSKSVRKAEEDAQKAASDILIKEGAGTARNLKQKYEIALSAQEDELQKVLAEKSINHKASDVLGKIREEISDQYSKTLSAEEIDGIVDDLPVSSLKKKLLMQQESDQKIYEGLVAEAEKKIKNNPGSIHWSEKLVKDKAHQQALEKFSRMDKPNVGSLTTNELNELRREVDKRFTTNNQWIKTATGGQITSAQTTADVLRGIVKDAVPESKPMFDRQSAFIKGIDAALNSLSTTKGPVNTASKIAAGAAGGGVGAGIGFSVGGPFGAAIGGLLGIGVEELGQSTIGRTGAAVILRQLGGAGSKFSQSELVNFGRLLVKLGIIKKFTGE